MYKITEIHNNIIRKSIQQIKSRFDDLLNKKPIFESK